MYKASKFILNFTFLIICVTALNAQTHVKSKVILVDGGSKITRDEICNILSTVLEEVNKIHEGKGDLRAVQNLFSESGFYAFKELVENTNIFSTIPEYRTRLLETATGQWEVRGLRVRVALGETEGDDVQELVFVLNSRLFIVDIHFAIELHHYKSIIAQGLKLDDLINRQQILEFLEKYRTAHNRKDIEFLEKTYSDDALIIIGQIVKQQEGDKDYLGSSTLGEEKIRLIRLDKNQYISNLRQVFKGNAFVRVIFDNVELIRHSRYPDIYGIKVKQRWNSSTYSDEGHLFIMMDFKDPNRPLIHVRSWQEQPFDDGSVVGLGDFRIVE